MRKNNARTVALGGMLAAVAIVIMCLGGLIPFATYICPMLCTVIQFTVLQFCGKKIAWCWFAVVAVLCFLVGPDKEAGAVFLLLGYYPMVKPYFDRMVLGWLWKLLLFYSAIGILYGLLLRLLGLDMSSGELEAFGWIGLVVMLLLGTLVFVLLDRVLSMAEQKLRRR